MQPMVDLQSQHKKIRHELLAAMERVLDSGRYIGGSEVDNFAHELAQYLQIKHVIPCANGTDALQIALMALGLKRGDEVIVPTFTYIATAEVIGLLGLKPVFVDVDEKTFNIDVSLIERAITPKTRAIVPVHLFGQSADMQAIQEIAQKYRLFIVEDNAQSMGAEYLFSDGTRKKTGTIGDIGCTSFFPSKNLGALGDGGAMMTNDDQLALKMKMIANHGQSRLYYHDVLGVNSRLDAFQAAFLRIKLKQLDTYNACRSRAAKDYDFYFKNSKNIEIPYRAPYSTHVFHQYTLKINDDQRDALKSYLEARRLPAMIYYPVPLHHQKAFKKYYRNGSFPVTETLCRQVISLPMHSEHSPATLLEIADAVLSYFEQS